MTPESRLAEFAAALQFGDVPREAVATAIRLCVDTLAAGLAGTTAPGIEPLRAASLAQGGAPESTVWGVGAKLPAPEATFINAAAAAALDYDSVHQESILHADAVILPVALALGERMGASGQEFLTAYIVGVEIAHRLSTSTPRRGGWFQSSTAGVFGAAAAAARLLKLDPERTGHALGIALSLSAGTKQCIVERTLTKRLQTAFAARSGLQAALLASQGITGPSHWLDGPYGWWKQYEAGVAGTLLDGLGERYDFRDTGIKKYPCCLCSHAAVDAALGLVRDYQIAADDVEDLSVTISPYMFKIVGAPFEPGSAPQVAAQFSIQYALACAALRRGFTLADLETDAILDSNMVSRVREVTVKTDESWPGHLVPALVTMRSRRLGALSRRVDTVPGSPANPVSDEDLRAKFLDCASRAATPLEDRQAGAMLKTIEDIGSLARIDALYPVPA